MGFIIGLLTFVMVLDCLALILLVLVQLPKKEAGAGLAFGGAASDALFGAGSGNVLTKVTKYAATLFFVLAIMLTMMQRHYASRSGTRFQRLLEQPGKAPAAAVTPSRPAAEANSITPTNRPLAPATGTNVLLTTPVAVLTNLPAVVTTNAPAAPR